MADDKNGRNKQADDERRRQRERDVAEARARGDEAEPAGEELGDLDGALRDHDYPTTGEQLIEAYGDRTVESKGGWRSLEDILTPAAGETFDSPDDVRTRIQNLIDRS